MRKTGSIVCFALIVAGVGTVLRTGPTKKARLFKPSSHERAEQLRVPPRLNEAYQLLLSGQYLRAEELYRSAEVCGCVSRLGQPGEPERQYIRTISPSGRSGSRGAFSGAGARRF